MYHTKLQHKNTDTFLGEEAIKNLHQTNISVPMMNNKGQYYLLHRNSTVENYGKLNQLLVNNNYSNIPPQQQKRNSLINKFDMNIAQQLNKQMPITKNN